MDTSRRNILTRTAQAAAMAAGGAMLVESAKAQAPVVKRNPLNPTPPANGARPLFSGATALGNLVFLAGVGYHEPGEIEVHTREVLRQMEQTLIKAGSSLQKVMKVNVYLHDLAHYDRMNAVYRSFDWGMVPPVRTTIAAAAGIPGNSLIEIDMIAYI
jgi:2-iminobutanoate/2-iminopropanoate deaminase